MNLSRAHFGSASIDRFDVILGSERLGSLPAVFAAQAGSAVFASFYSKALT
ncbi:MAG: hypothetical protein R3F51_08660 [Cyanobacteriota/Melainabacteria group bacterium]